MEQCRQEIEMCGNPYRVYLTNLQRETNGGRPGWVFCWPKHPVDQEAFAETLLLLKLMVPSAERAWREESKTWWVAESVDLSIVFTNWGAEIDRVKRQLVMPGF
jgi:hypothetical protein